MNVLVQGIQEFLVTEWVDGDVITVPTQGRTKAIELPAERYKRWHLVSAETATEAEERVTAMWARDDQTTYLREEEERLRQERDGR